ncbi:hypothetical protein [Oxynema aestuarii]|uniref:Uncharacterized protein n=1 Tax=Oxynema aestuarii AP17 TaxID=2064643 RepID=A0A6H1TV18_9CYAN|nr:hypothetical protein [Oxynema aestuarii]QIZ70458.1 hypothetical protein HCG48_07585 [Oxynema aestuarii AP17]
MNDRHFSPQRSPFDSPATDRENRVKVGGTLTVGQPLGLTVVPLKTTIPVLLSP